MKIQDKRSAGAALGRAAIAQRVVNLACVIADKETSYKDAMKLAGQIKVISDAATFDDYWGGKVQDGVRVEESLLDLVNLESISSEGYIKSTRKYE